MKQVSVIVVVGTLLLAAPALCARLAHGVQPMSSAGASGQDDAGSPEQTHQLGCSAKAHRMLRALAGADYEGAAATFSEASRAMVTPARLQQIWSALSGQYGEHVRLGRGPTASAEKKGYYLAGVPMKYEQTTLIANVMCDGNDDIVDFKIIRAPDSKPTR